MRIVYLSALRMGVENAAKSLPCDQRTRKPRVKFEGKENVY
jgi:hypothetical protein